MSHQTRYVLSPITRKVDFHTSRTDIYKRVRENYNPSQDGKGWKEMGIHNRTSRIVGITMENTTLWLASGVSQHLSN